MLEIRATTSRLTLASVAAALALAACNQTPSTPAATTGTQPVTAAPIAALPLATATPPATPSAPAVLPPPATRIRVAPRPKERYRYVDRAAQYNLAFGDTPPDYTVDYQGTRPWIWRANSGAYRVAEQLPQGERYYYYDAGSDQPFYVADPRGGYSY
ncbi:MAG: hypothetical protein JO290_13250, partial [Sphingomonadaceae bacterium]|nr:hypothetical protein [Sphingomonadaceae bacterium]